MKIYKKAILPLGFRASAVACGIKKSNKLDLALFYSCMPAKASCQFTTNKIPAAPIQLNKLHLKNNRRFQAIIVNSGNANCFTGKLGFRDALGITKVLSNALNIEGGSILIASTGIIGRRLPIKKIKEAIPRLVAGLDTKGIEKAKLAIMTTDTMAKEITVKFKIGKQIITVCGIAKGAGMIAPNLATMLCFILTDANITSKALKEALANCTASSFNCITIDGCMSTNDSVMILANGAAGNEPIDIAEPKYKVLSGPSQRSYGINKNFYSFTNTLNTVCLALAEMIVRDAEGATKFIRIKVNSAKSFREAREVALSIANSSLFKAAMYGENPNFGRIIASVGASGIDVKEKDLKIKASPLNKNHITVDISVNRGNSSAVVYTSDLTPEYVKINAAYN